MNDEEYKILSEWAMAGYKIHDMLREKGMTLPAMKFPQDMTVQPLTPFGGAIVRFFLNGYSVYLDCFSKLGCMEYPYWEVYDGEDCHRFKMEDWQEMIDFVVSLGRYDENKRKNGSY